MEPLSDPQTFLALRCRLLSTGTAPWTHGVLALARLPERPERFEVQLSITWAVPPGTSATVLCYPRDEDAFPDCAPGAVLVLEAGGGLEATAEVLAVTSSYGGELPRTPRL